jgi:secreted PhoX family phosphatase
MSVSRRQFLTYVGMGTYAALARRAVAGQKAEFPLRRRKGPAPDFFKPIEASSKDELLLPSGYRYDLICSWQDALGSKSPDGQPEFFGFNNDFLAYIPIDALRGGNDQREGLLWVNHEYPLPLFVSKYPGTGRKTEEQILAEKASVGGSVLHIRYRDGKWQHVPGSKYTRRYTASYPRIAVTGPTASLVPWAVGTLANCSGGRTPWHTILSCEENYPDFNSTEEDNYRWSEVPSQKIDEHQYGWIVEVDPFGELPPRKHSALGRFKHENAAIRLGPSGRLIVYMGQDEEDQYLYKFVSAAAYNPRTPRAEQYKLFTEGTLYAADFQAGRWLPLDYRRNKDLFEKEAKNEEKKEDRITSQAELLLHAPHAAGILGATPLDRPEVCVVHPLDGTLYVALTYNTTHGNLYGQIVRLLEDDDNPEGDRFRYEIFLAGGPQSGLACPDNLAFDREGNLWVVCDIASDQLNKGAYRTFGNNGIYVVPTRGPSAGDAFQFASGPVECELTGPCFTADETTLFLSVQHPGEETKSLDALTSHWPAGGKAMPRPSVVAISGFPARGK